MGDLFSFFFFCDTLICEGMIATDEELSAGERDHPSSISASSLLPLTGFHPPTLGGRDALWFLIEPGRDMLSSCDLAF